jgi:hypothetical protein
MANPLGEDDVLSPLCRKVVQLLSSTEQPAKPRTTQHFALALVLTAAAAFAA